jgi:hypothetical protein
MKEEPFLKIIFSPRGEVIIIVVHWAGDLPPGEDVGGARYQLKIV